MMKRIPIILFGAGGVGRALLQQIVDSRQVVYRRNNLYLNVVAVIDSKSWCFQSAGLSDGDLRHIISLKKAGQRVSQSERPDNLEALTQIAAAGLEGVQVVDVTAESGLEPLLDRALELGYGVVLANKKPLAGPWATAQRYYNNPRVRHESTVGGGQPVIAIMRYLLDTNDAPDRVEGQLSGTMGYICGRLHEGARFSQAVAEAKAKGYTEPDPREDLGGRDVMRKMMILGRMLGWPLEEADMHIESLYPAEMSSLSVPQFMEAIAASDAAFQERVRAAEANGAILRHVAELENGRGTVGLKEVDGRNPLAHLKYISFRTNYYREQPMMIGGKGAGVDMTAAGVLGDIIGLAREQQ